jgi:hypothetical protein
MRGGEKGKDGLFEFKMNGAPCKNGNLQCGFVSSHFFFLLRHVKQPVRRRFTRMSSRLRGLSMDWGILGRPNPEEVA